jgi:hypothetical protein
MEIDHISFAGWEDCVRLTHQGVTLIVTTEVGPRVIYCSLNDRGNLFYVNADHAGTNGGTEWKIYGGHRLWCAPEVKEFTYAPDNQPVQVTVTGRGVRFAAPVEKSGLLKVIVISPLERKSGFKVEHVIENLGRQTLNLAPWALTVMSAGGTAIIPHNLARPHQLLPTHTISLWGYTDPGDPRLRWGKRYIQIRQDASAATALKIGLQNPYGWAGYALNRLFFLKRFAWEESAGYPDLNCNFEAYTTAEILELETLAPLRELAPGAVATHMEEWQVFDQVPTPATDEDVDQSILPLI